MTPAFYRFTAWCLALLPVDEPGRRVFDEVLADWRKEAATAAGLVSSPIVAVRGLFAVLRAICGVAVREVESIRHGGVLTRIVLWTAAYAAVVAAITQMAPVSPGIVRPSVASRAYGMVSVVAFFFPIAVLLATGLAPARRSMPALGVALVTVVVGVPLLGWALPAANRAFMDANPSRYVNHAGEVVAVPSRPGEGLMMSTGRDGFSLSAVSPPNNFVNDLTLIELGGRVIEGPNANGWSAIRWLIFFGAYVAICALAPILAAVARGLTARLHYPLVVVTAVLLYVQPWNVVSFGEFKVTWWLGASWVPVVWIVLCLTVLGHRRLPTQITNSQ